VWKEALKETERARACVAHLYFGSFAHRHIAVPLSAPLLIGCQFSLAVLVPTDFCHQFQSFPRVAVMELPNPQDRKRLKVRVNHGAGLLSFLWFWFTWVANAFRKFFHLLADLSIAVISPSNHNRDLFRAIIVWAGSISLRGWAVKIDRTRG
jgi:hypothetical protein